MLNMPESAIQEAQKIDHEDPIKEFSIDMSQATKESSILDPTPNDKSNIKMKNWKYSQIKRIGPSEKFKSIKPSSFVFTNPGFNSKAQLDINNDQNTIQITESNFKLDSNAVTIERSGQQSGKMQSIRESMKSIDNTKMVKVPLFYTKNIEMRQVKVNRVSVDIGTSISSEHSMTRSRRFLY